MACQCYSLWPKWIDLKKKEVILIRLDRYQLYALLFRDEVLNARPLQALAWMRSLVVVEILLQD